MIETMLFDCWGTLINAPNLMRRDASAEFIHRAITANGYEIDLSTFRDAYIEMARRQQEEAQKDFRELDYVQRIDSTLHAIGFQNPQRRVLAERAWSDYLAEWPKQSALYEETEMLLSSIKGRYRLGLVTNFSDGPTARRVFENFGFDVVFDSLVVSGEVGFRKPNRIIFERALSELGSKPWSTVMVGDTLEADIVGAKKMGMKAILIDADGSQAWGAVSPDIVVKNIGEVRESLKSL